MTRRKARTDDNQKRIIHDLRQHGFSVEDLSGVGSGVPDIAVGIKANVKGGTLPFTLFIEIKDGDKPPSARQLTKAQKKFFRQWRGSAVVVHTANEAVAVCREIRRGKFSVLHVPRFYERLPEGA